MANVSLASTPVSLPRNKKDKNKPALALGLACLIFYYAKFWIILSILRATPPW